MALWGSNFWVILTLGWLFLGQNILIFATFSAVTVGGTVSCDGVKNHESGSLIVIVSRLESGPSLCSRQSQFHF
jgi:hypothetical protein